MTLGKQLENEVRQLLDEYIPASTLSGVCLFQPDQFVLQRNFGSEIDHLLHFQSSGRDHLLICECKAQSIRFVGSGSSDAAREWVVTYSKNGDEQRKHIKSQLFAQSQALLQNLYPKKRASTIHVHALAISSDPSTPRLTTRPSAEGNLTFHLLSLNGLRELLTNQANFVEFLGFDPGRWRPLRVQQSDILRKVRHALVLPELGHPEVPNGMRFVARCRQVLDCELTKLFRPTSEGRWVINGGAGMGKTVLLAYAATVFASGRIITEQRADRQLPKRELVAWKNPKIEEPLPVVGRRKVVLYGLNPKQCQVLNQECARFAEEFKAIAEEMDDPTLGVIPQPPRVELWHDSAPPRGDVVLIDEAHDLSVAAQRSIGDWWTQGAGKRYLVLACDRHQKLRLLGDQATVLEGLSFAGCSTRLVKNYRSPSPIYGAALALMFRWFAKGGAKVLPTEDALSRQFGFHFENGQKLRTDPGAPLVLTLKNDCHPANYWSYTVARYTHWEIADAWIDEWGLTQSQVLWVRFAHTDYFLDQQRLDKVQLRDLLVHDPDHVIDTHIKGREFPVVVIEGLPPAGVDQTNQDEMLRWRRRLYLCASRATCFLFFVYPGSDGSPTAEAWNEELLNLLRSCSMPTNRNEASSKFWQLRFDAPEVLLRPDVFADLEESATGGIGAQMEQPASISTNSSSSSEPAITNDQPENSARAINAGADGATETKPPTADETADSKADAVATPITLVAPPPRMPEKDFQRIFGDEQGWKAYYKRYLETGLFPTHRSESRRLTRQFPVSSTVTPKQPEPDPQPNPAGGPKHKGKEPKPTIMTPRMIARHLEIPPFRIIKLAQDKCVESGHTDYWVDLDRLLPPEVVKAIYREKGVLLPKPTEVSVLRAKN